MNSKRFFAALMPIVPRLYLAILPPVFIRFCQCEEARQRLVLGLVHDQEEGLRAAHQRRCLSSPFSLHLPPPPVEKCPAQCASLETDRARNVLGIGWSRGKARGKEGGNKGYAYLVKSLEWTTQGLNRTRKGARADGVGEKERVERPEAPWCPTAAATARAGERFADDGGSRQMLAALFHRVSGGLRKMESDEGGERWSPTRKIRRVGAHTHPACLYHSGVVGRLLTTLSP